jgi:PTH1 family peptidyl-tRNA hydrolase
MLYLCSEQCMAIQLLVGLGNPGARYVDTRHNAGFWLVETIASAYQLQFRTENRFSGEIARLQHGTVQCWLLKPQTFMNCSGTAISALANFYKIPPSDILLAHDELDLAPGTVRLKKGGGHGGHNGLRDTIKHLSSNDFMRLRLGIGHPGHRDEVTDHVLNAPSQSERSAIMQAIQLSVDNLDLVLSGAFDKAMQRLHTK